MAVERKKKVKDQAGNVVEGTVVGVLESTERFSDVKLDDGTILMTKMNIIQAVRVDGKWDNEGNPQYVVKSQNVVVIAESPESLMRKVH